MTQLIAGSKAEQAYSAADPWTVVHFSAGLGAGLLDMGFWPAMASAVAYEAFEYYFQHDELGQKFFGVSHPEHPVWWRGVSSRLVPPAAEIPATSGTGSARRSTTA